MDVIKCDRVSHFIGSHKVLDSLHFVVKKGEHCAVLGLDPAASSSFFELIQGKARASSGRLWIYGEMPGIFSDRLGYAPDHLPDSVLSLRELFFFKASLFGPVSQRWMARLIALFGLSRVLPMMWSDLSADIQYRALLALALMTQPSLLLIDMVLDHLSSPVLSDFQSCLASLLSDHMTIIFTTKQLVLAKNLAQTVCIFHKGRLLFYGTPSALAHHFGEVRVTVPLSVSVTIPLCIAVCVYEGARHLFFYRHQLDEVLSFLYAAGVSHGEAIVSDLAVRDIIFQVLLRNRTDWDVL